MEMLDGRIARIERALGCRDPGSILQRVTVESDLLEREGLKKKHDGLHHSMWRVTIGEPMKNNIVIAYGHTIAEAMNKADEKIKHRIS
jgi:hypothetical protein